MAGGMGEQKLTVRQNQTQRTDPTLLPRPLINDDDGTCWFLRSLQSLSETGPSPLMYGVFGLLEPIRLAGLQKDDDKIGVARRLFLEGVQSFRNYP